MRFSCFVGIFGHLILALTCHAQSLTVQVVGRTATQAVLSYTASGACTVEVSESSSYAPLVHDVDPALFAGANLDTRAEALSSGANHVFVVGKRLIEKGSDGRNYSRALQTNTVHYFRVTCGTSVSAGSFTTANIPFGMTNSDGMQADPNNPGGYVYPTILPDRTQNVIDPQTGVLVKRLTVPSDVTVSPNVPNWSSAGFHELCSPVLSSNGYYRCIIINDWAPMLYGINPTTGDVRFLGTLYYWGQAYGLNEGVHGCYNGASAMWDETNANVMYCSNNTPSGDLVALQLTYTGNDQPVTSGQVGGMPPPAPLTILNLTPSPNTLLAQLKAFAPSLSSGCSIEAYQAGHLVISCRSGEQDTYAWIGAYDLGNKLPLGSGGTGHVKSLIKMWEQPGSRWCGQHTYEYMGNVPVMSFATQTLKGSGLPGSGPYLVALSSSMPSATAGNLTTVTVSSAWDSSWGSAPSGFQPGEPLSPVADHFLMQAQTGDLFYADGEFMVLVQKLSSTQWVLQRGLGQDQGYYYPRPHSSGTSLMAYCNAGGAANPLVLPYIWWNFQISPDAFNRAAYAPNFGGHPVARGNYRVDAGWTFRNGNIADPATWGLSNFTGNINPSPRFAGAHMPADGNYFEKHPSMPFSTPGWFLDVLPYIGGNNATSGSDNDTLPLGGNLYQYFYNGLDTPHYNGDGLNRKQVATFAFGGTSLMIDISGPNSVIDGSSSHSYHYCVANKAGECVSSSQPGDIFFNVPNLTIGSRYCKGNEFYDGSQNVCIGDVPTVGFSVSQFKIAGDTTGQSIRVLSKMFSFAHYSGTGNTKPLPDGSWTLYNSFSPAPSGIFAIKIPPLPVADGIDRTTFVRAPLTLTPPSGQGIVSAKVYFGYSEQGPISQYYCTSRREACVAVSPAVTDANPFRYNQSDPYSPAPCITSCSIILPVLPMHTAYFRVSYLNASANEVAAELGVASEQSVIATGSSILAVPPPAPAALLVIPLRVTLALSQALQYSTNITGTLDAFVYWSLNPPLGTLSGAGLYIAPSIIPSEQTVTITATFQPILGVPISASATVTITPTALSADMPRMTQAPVNAASSLGGAVAPGEIVTILGTGFGPAEPVTLIMDESGSVSTMLADTRVLFDGLPAPLLYVQRSQINAVTPFSMTGKAATQMEVEHAGQLSSAVTLPVEPSAPGLFTVDSSGRGRGIIFNEDATMNSPENSAFPGSVVTIYATGGGQTDASGIEGKITVDPPPMPLLPVTAAINGVNATVFYASLAPGLVAGTMRIVVRIPEDAGSGPVLPVTIKIGNASSQPGVTLAVR